MFSSLLFRGDPAIMDLPNPRGLVVALISSCFGRLGYGGFPYATQKRRVVVVLVNRSATSGRAFLSAAVSSLAACTGFQVIRYSPARSSSESPIAALMASLMPSASAWASSIRACSYRSSRTLLSISFALILCSPFLIYRGPVGHLRGSCLL